MKRNELQAYEYINRPYDAVRDALLANPAAACARGADLRARTGPVEVGAEVDIKILAVEADARFRSTTRLQLEWMAVERPGLFPTMRGTLSIYPLTATETQLDFTGTYDPPLGVVGDALDALALGRLARASVAGFVQDVAQYLRNPA